MVVTEEVSQFIIFKDERDIHPLNIYSIFITDDLLKCGKNKDIKEPH
jgi:hypothetical protein